MTHNYSSTHSFNIELAAKYGIEEAIIISHFQYWINHNQNLGKNFINGRTWTYQTRETIAAHFPYFNAEKVRRITDSLVEKGILVKGNFNKIKVDKTLWYAFENEKMFTIGNFAKWNVENDSRSVENAKPIPHTIPHTKNKYSKSSSKTDPVAAKPVLENDDDDEKISLLSFSVKNSKEETIKVSDEEIYTHLVREKCDFSKPIIREAVKRIKAEAENGPINAPLAYLVSTCAQIQKSGLPKKNKAKPKTIDQEIPISDAPAGENPFKYLLKNKDEKNEP